MKCRASCESPRQREIDDFVASCEDRQSLPYPRRRRPAPEDRREGTGARCRKRAVLRAEEFRNWLCVTPLIIAASTLLGAEHQKCIETALLAPAHSCTFCQKGSPGPAILQASFLIWQSKEWGLEFASKSYAPSDPSSSTQTFHQQLSVPDFAWSPGFKVDFGYELPYDGWDLDSRWTFYRGNCTNLKKHLDSQIVPAGLGIVPIWHYPFIDFSSTSSPLRFQNASSNWKLFFNSFDVELGREFVPMRPLIMRLHLGAKGSWTRQFYHVEYGNGTTFSGIVITPPADSFQYLGSHLAFSSHSWGLGPRGGLESKWRLGWGFNLIADGALSLLGSSFDLCTEWNDQLINLSTSTGVFNNLHKRESLKELVPVLEGKIGLDWGYCFGRRPIYFGLTVAYEAQYWWSQNHAYRNFAFLAPGNMWDMRGDLQMHGLTATLRSDF